MVSLRVRWLFLSTLGLGAVLAGPAQADNLQSGAPIALVEDFDSGAVLYEKSADEPMAPAAMTQLMTADVVFDQLRQSRIHLDVRFAVSEYAWRTGGGPSRGPAMFLDVHSEARVEDLIRGLAIQSGNDAAITLAEGVSGSSGAFAELMNKRAGELGLAHSHFVNSFGKSDPAQKVTARDMAALAADIIRNFPDGYRYFSEKDFTWNKIHQLNRNPLLAALRFPAITRRDASLRAEAAELMRFVGLEQYLDARADSMPYGALKRLEIARALALKPRIIFLDEPAAGLNPKETIEVDALVRKVADSGVTVVLVEHDMKMVMNLSDRILVLDYGKKLAEGTGEEVRRNPDVIAAYLGTHA